MTGLTYGETLLDATHSRYPELVSARITVSSNVPRPITAQRHWGRRFGKNESRLLWDANGNNIGTIELHLICSSTAIADRVASELSRRIYSAASLSDPDPFVATANRAPTAQAMIDLALDRDPTIITLAFHVTPPRGTINSIVASNFGRIGKPADLDDLGVIKEAKIVQEVTNNGKRLAIELPLLDSRRRVIGALSTSFRLEPGFGTEQIETRAIALRDSLSKQTPSIAALFNPTTASRQVKRLRACHS